LGRLGGEEAFHFLTQQGYPMAGGTASNYFVHSLLRAHDWQHRPQLDDVCQWWRGGGRGVLALVGMDEARRYVLKQGYRFPRLAERSQPSAAIEVAA
jgi:hypothetical protein